MGELGGKEIEVIEHAEATSLAHERHANASSCSQRISIYLLL